VTAPRTDLDDTLVPCAGCARLLRVLEERCPFCGAEPGWRFSAVLRLRRLAHVTIAAVGIATCAACGNDAPVPPGPPAAELVPMVPPPALQPTPAPLPTPAVEMHPIPPPVVEPPPPITKRRVRRARVVRRDQILIAPPYGAPPIDGPRLA
jgi:hypothetical protein